MNELPSTYICFDIETSGLSFDKNHVIEIGYTFVQEGIPIKSNSTLIQLPEGQKLDWNITRITGINNLDLRYHGIPIIKALDWFHQLIGEGYPLVGHNVFRFDHPFLLSTARRHNHPLKNTFSVNRLIDTAVLYKGKKMDLERKQDEPFMVYASRVLDKPIKGLKYNLKVACEDSKVRTDDVVAHRAAADVLITHRLYEALRTS